MTLSHSLAVQIWPYRMQATTSDEPGLEFLRSSFLTLNTFLFQVQKKLRILIRNTINWAFNVIKHAPYT